MGISKRLEEARKAFASGDKAASAAAHSPERIAQAAAEHHGGTGSQYLGDMVYGGLDGIVTTFAVVSGVAGAELGTSIILIMGLANLFADGFSMATGAFLSAKSEQRGLRPRVPARILGGRSLSRRASAPSWWRCTRRAATRTPTPRP